MPSELEVRVPLGLVITGTGLVGVGLVLTRGVVVLLGQLAVGGQVAFPCAERRSGLFERMPGVHHGGLEVAVQGVPERARRVSLPAGARPEQVLDLAVAVVERVGRGLHLAVERGDLLGHPGYRVPAEARVRVVSHRSLPPVFAALVSSIFLRAFERLSSNCR